MITRISNAVLLALPLLFLLSVPARADKLDEIIAADMTSRQIPAVSLLVVKNGRIIRANGYGLANVELRVAATPDSAYQIGSMTKPFTAAAIMLLVEAGKVSLDESILKYLPELPAAWSPVTVRHTLTHTSGIKDYPELADTEAERSKAYTKAQIISLVSGAPLEFQPGQKWSYSNTGYFLLGMIIERVSGKEYGDFLRDRIFGPLDMNATRLNDPGDIVPNRAAGYVVRDGQLYNAQPVSSSHSYAAGALLSTAVDLAKWDAALYTEKVLHASSVKQMMTPATLNDGQAALNPFFNNYYGFGWFLGQLGGHQYVDNPGGIPGFSADMIRFPDDRLTIIVLTNKDDSENTSILADDAPRPWDIAKEVASSYISIDGGS